MNPTIVSLSGLFIMSLVTACIPGTTVSGTKAVQQAEQRPTVQQGYTDNGDGTISDKANQLMWVKAVPAWPMRYEQAKVVARSVRLGGYTNWRLPTAYELQSHNNNHLCMTEVGPNADEYGFVLYRRPYVSSWLKTFGFVLPSRPLQSINYWSSTDDHASETFMGGPCVLVVMLTEGFNTASGMRRDAAMNYTWAVRSLK